MTNKIEWIVTETDEHDLPIGNYIAESSEEASHICKSIAESNPNHKAFVTTKTRRLLTE